MNERPQRLHLDHRAPSITSGSSLAADDVGSQPSAPSARRIGAIDAATTVPSGPFLRSVLIAMRPRQWIKNLLVFAAPGAAGLLGRPGVLGRTTLAAGIFLIASAGTYLVNDAIDAPSDRVHPEKRNRPIAAGEISTTFAIVIGASLLVLAILAATFLYGLQLASVIGAYVAITVSYTIWLKRVAVVELACVSAGFVLRAVAGGAAVHIPISPWFAIVTSSAALLVVTGKRSAEIDALGEDGAAHRQVLERYPQAFLRSLRTLAAAVAIIAYCVWAFERAAHVDIGRPDADNIFFELSIIPFVLGVVSVELAIERGDGGAPEELVLRNRAIQVLALACLALVAVGIYT